MSRNRIVLVLTVAAALVSTALPAWGRGARPAGGTFTALTYNVAGLPEQLSGSEPARNSPLISPLLNGYDLVLLQEDWVDALAQYGARPAEAEAIPRTGYHDLIVQSAQHRNQSEAMASPPPLLALVDRLPTGPTISGDGLNHLSDVPVVGGVERVMWARCHGEVHVTAAETAFEEAGLDDPTGEDLDGGSADCGAQKGFSVTTLVFAPGVEADLYNLHADAGGHPKDLEARRENFTQLADFIARHSAGRAVLLGGDTNLRTGPGARDDATWIAFLAASGLTDVCQVVECGADAGVIDKFAFRNGRGAKLVPESHAFQRSTFVREADGEPLSDHDPLAVRFRWAAKSR